MTEAAKQSDHPRIWLQNDADADRHEGRLWCQDNVWNDGEPTEYVRADLFKAQERLIETLTASLSNLLDCSNAIVGASLHDDRSADAFEQFNNARGIARTALAQARKE